MLSTLKVELVSGRGEEGGLLSAVTWGGPETQQGRGGGSKIPTARPHQRRT